MLRDPGAVIRRGAKVYQAIVGENSVIGKNSIIGGELRLVEVAERDARLVMAVLGVLFLLAASFAMWREVSMAVKSFDLELDHSLAQRGKPRP